MNFIRSGSTFMMPLPRTGVAHLWIVLTDPDPLTTKVVAVMLVSEKPTTDKTVTFSVGDHPFIEWNSNIDYGGAQLFHVSRLESAIVASDRALRESLPNRLLETVRKGVFASSETINWMKDYCKSRFDENGKTISAPAKKKG